MAQAFKGAGYNTAYIGKWHVDGRGRSAYIPPERRQGFEHWMVLECTHDYNDSAYYAGDDETKLMWDEYDAIPQTREAQKYITDHSQDEDPFFASPLVGSAAQSVRDCARRVSSHVRSGKAYSPSQCRAR